MLSSVEESVYNSSSFTPVRNVEFMKIGKKRKETGLLYKDETGSKTPKTEH